jgi:uncharacterized membrane protein
VEDPQTRRNVAELFRTRLDEGADLANSVPHLGLDLDLHQDRARGSAAHNVRLGTFSSSRCDIVCCHSDTEDPPSGYCEGVEADSLDRYFAVLDQLQPRLLERTAHHIGARGGAPVDDHCLWAFTSLDLPPRRADNKAEDIRCIQLGIIGVAIIFIDQLKVQSFLAFLGCVAVVVGSYAAAQASILVKAKGGAFHPAALLFCQMVCGLPAIIVYSLAAEGDPTGFHWTWRAIFCVVYLTIAGTIAAFWLYYWLLRRIESTKAMMISLVTPLLAVMIGAVVLGETLPPQTGLGGLLIIGSIGLIVVRKGKRTQSRRVAQTND